MDSSTIVPIIAALIVLWVITAALKEFALRRGKKIRESAFKEKPRGKISAAERLLQAAAAPFRIISLAWSKLLFPLMAENCLLITLTAALPLLALFCTFAAGALSAPGLLYAAWSRGSGGAVVLWFLAWLLCLIAVPGLLAGAGAAYRGEACGTSPGQTGRLRSLRLVLILAGIGIVLTPLSSRFLPGLLSGEIALLSRGAEVQLVSGDTTGSAAVKKPGSRPAGAGKNLLKNGDFELLRGSELLGWQTDIYGDNTGSVRFCAVRGGAFSGDYYVTIENLAANDGKFMQLVRVKPDSLYKLSCMVKAAGVGQQGKGANITVLGIVKSSRDLKDTAGKWEEVELYGRTGPTQEEMTVTVRLGGYAAVSTGKACFDDFRVQRVTNLPAGTKAVRLYQIRPEHRQPAGLPIIHTFMYSSIFLFLLVFLLAYYFFFKNEENELPVIKFKYLELTFFIILAGLFALRLWLAPVITGFYTDVNTFKAWAGMAAHRGLADFYSGAVQVDYPPGYIYILYLIGLLKNLFSFSFESKSFLLMIKMPAMIADMLTAVIIYRLVSKAAPDFKGAAAVLSLFYALNPAVILNSAVWGQVDSFFTLFILLALLLLHKEKFAGAAVVFVIAVLIKPQALIFTPVGIYAFIRRRSVKVFLLSFLAMIAAFVLLILPFALNRPPLWIFNLYKSTLSSYPFASLNAFNLFALNGGNYAKETGIFLFFSYRVWGYIFIAAIVAFSALLFFRGREKDKSGSKIFFTATFIIAAVFILASKMHERYLFPVLCLSLISYIYSRDRRLLFIFTGFTLTHFINTALILDLVVRTGVDRFPPANAWLYLISFINLALLIYTVQTGLALYRRE